MVDLVGNRINSAIRHLLLMLTAAMLIPMAACNGQHSASVQTTPKTFASPEDAGNALLAAAKSGDQNELLAIFGPNSKELIFSGDPVQDKNTVAAFATGYEVMHRWRRMTDGSQTLLVGAQNFPFPIPLKKDASGQWFFDTAAGKEEILNRRVGRNELAVIQVCGAVVDAQAQYLSQKHGGLNQYAQKFISDAGEQNGLYWPEVQGQPRSPLGPLAADATSEGYKVDPSHHQPFHGYYFVMLDKQGPDAKGGAKDYIVDGKMRGGFAVVAYPAQYGDSGIMTFLVNQEGAIFQKDLGKNTAEVATAMTEFNPDKSWKVVE